MSTWLLDLAALLQTVAWPLAVVFAVWKAAQAVEHYAQLVAAQYRDSTLTAATAKAELAYRESKNARDAFDEAREATQEELSTLKAALLDR